MTGETHVPPTMKFPTTDAPPAMLQRFITLTLLLAAWTLATLMVVGGVMLAPAGSKIGLFSPLSVSLFGLAGIAGGVYTFEVIVADRIFPHAPRRWAWTVEFLSGGLMLVFAIAAIVIVLTGR